MSWGMHATNFLYTKSTASVLNSNPINLIGGNVGNSAALNTMTGLNDTSVTYPAFYNLPDGDLLFMYRTGVVGKRRLSAPALRYGDRSVVRARHRRHPNLVGAAGAWE